MYHIYERTIHKDLKTKFSIQICDFGLISLPYVVLFTAHVTKKEQGMAHLGCY